MAAKFCDVACRLATVSPATFNIHVANCWTCQTAREELRRNGREYAAEVRVATTTTGIYEISALIVPPVASRVETSRYLHVEEECHD